ncbi:MAG: hypothetical protein LC808_00810 [Actinobacteria bacterium]|nr:hypothetical protein [Actinomycetota bacterium]
MAMDIRRGLQAGIESALEQPAPPSKPKTPHLSARRALLVGAGLMTAGRLMARSRASGIVESLQQRLADGYHAEEDEDFDEEPEAEEDEEQVRPRTRRRTRPRTRGRTKSRA